MSSVFYPLIPADKASSALFWTSSLLESQRPSALRSSTATHAAAHEATTQLDAGTALCVEGKGEWRVKRGRDNDEDDLQRERSLVNFPSVAVEQSVDSEEKRSRTGQRIRSHESSVVSIASPSPQPQKQPLVSALEAITDTVETVAHAPKKLDGNCFNDILAVSEALFQGLLGPVGIDVELNGTTALLCDPKGFALLLEAMEQDTVENLYSSHAAIKLFFILRGESYYTLNSSVCPPLLFLAKLLSAPKVTKLVLHAQSIYRLMFLFLGTDRVEVRNVIDIHVWVTVIERVCGPLPYTTINTNAESLWPLLPESVRDRIEVSLENAKQANLYDETATTCAGTVDTECDEAKTATSLLSSSSMFMVLPFAQLMERIRSLTTMYAYYDTYLRHAEDNGVTGVASMSLADVCYFETRVSFLCELMTYHGVFVDKALLDCMTADLNRQMAEINRKGDSLLREISGNHCEILEMETLSAEVLVNALQSRFDSLKLVCGSCEQKLRHISEFLFGEGTCADKNLAYLWLAMHERREFKRLLLEGFSNGVKIRARLVVALQATKTTTVEDKIECHNQQDGSASTSGVKHRLFFSLHPRWSVHHGTTGRIFCSRPCLQTVAKKPPLSRLAHFYSLKTKAQPLFLNHEWTLRQLYVPPPGCSFLTFDFNQIELRVLAHLSGDELLIQQLRSGSDVLVEMARLVMRLRRPEDVTPYLRQGVKVLVYGILYGMGPELLDLRLRQLREEAMGVSPEENQPPLSALQFMCSFNSCYPNVKKFLRYTRNCGFHEKQCFTLNGVRNLSAEADGNRRKQAAVASAIQGSAAVILQHAMLAVHDKRHEFISYFPAASFALVMSVHDELVYAVPDSALSVLAPKIQQVLEQQAVELLLKVPLPVSVKSGKSFGTLQPFPASGVMA